MVRGTTTLGAAAPSDAAVPAADPHAGRPEGRPLVLLSYVCGFTLAALFHGLDETLGVLGGVLNVVFGVYFCRHLAFAVAAARWAEHAGLPAALATVPLLALVAAVLSLSVAGDALRVPVTRRGLVTALRGGTGGLREAVVPRLQPLVSGFGHGTAVYVRDLRALDPSA